MSQRIMPVDKLSCYSQATMLVVAMVKPRYTRGLSGGIA